MRLGHGQRRSVLILWAWTALLSALVLYPALTDHNTLLAPIGVAALGIMLYTVFARGRRGADANGTTGGAGIGSKPVSGRSAGSVDAASHPAGS